MLFSKDTLKSFAASKGIENIEEESYRILSQDLEYRIKEVCQEAAKFMHASHRKKLNTSDVNNALISRNVEPLFGYESQEDSDLKNEKLINNPPYWQFPRVFFTGYKYHINIP